MFPPEWLTIAALALGVAGMGVGVAIALAAMYRGRSSRRDIRVIALGLVWTLLIAGAINMITSSVGT